MKIQTQRTAAQAGLLVLNDMHLTSLGEKYHSVDSGAKFREVLSLLCKQEQPQLIVLNGDICATDPDPVVYKETAELIQKLNIPVLAIPGNHDDPELMKKYLSLPEYNMKIAGAAKIGICPTDPYCGWADLAGINLFWLNSWDARISREQLDWLEIIRTDIPADRPTVVFMHHPPAYVPSVFMESNFPLLNRAEILSEIQKIPGLSRIFCGHYHISYDSSDPAVPLSMVSSSLYTIDPESDVHRILNYNAGYARVYPGKTLSWTVEELSENMLQNQHAI
ncbi:metallophosphoesterase family protein [Spirochaeta dissipatitropha]